MSACTSPERTLRGERGLLAKSEWRIANGDFASSDSANGEQRRAASCYTRLMLAPYRVREEDSRGRRYPEPPHPYRNPFQRDRDRVIHARAFRRLENKTQVFTRRYSDHFRTRLTHTMATIPPWYARFQISPPLGTPGPSVTS